MKMKRKMFSLFLALVMVLSCIPMPAMAVSDMPAMAVSDMPATVMSDVPATSEPIESAFTDPAFLGAVRELVGKTNGEHIYPADVESITELNVSDKYIANLQGIEHFTALKELNCCFNELLELDLSGNPNLEVLDCSLNTELASVNVSNCPQLRTLDCSFTALERLDIRSNTQLTKLVCYSTRLRTLNTSNNPALEELDTYDACLVNLDVSNNKNLTYLDCSYNNMSSPDSVIGRDTCNSLVGDSFCYEPQNENVAVEAAFTDQDFLTAVREAVDKPTGELTPADLAGVTELSVYNSGLKSLDGIEYLTSLETLDCTSNRLTELDVYSNKQLKSVHCGDNKLTDVDLSGNAELTTLDAYGNSLTAVDVSNSPLLESVNVTNNELTELDVSNNPNLNSLYCSSNAFTSIDEVKLPQKVSPDVIADAETTMAPVVSDDFLFEFLPQPLSLLFEVTMQQQEEEGPMTVSVNGSPGYDMRVYEFTDSDTSGIPAQYLENGASALIGDEGMPFLEELIRRSDSVGSFIARSKRYTGTVQMKDPRKKQYKMVTGEYNLKKNRFEGIAVSIVDSRWLHVKSLTFNSNYNNQPLVDVYNTNNPDIMSHGWHGKYSTFTVGLANAEDVEKAYIQVHRDYRGGSSDDRNKDIELTKRSDGLYQANLWLYGSEGSLGGDLSSGEIRVKCTTKSHPTTRKQIYTKPARIIFDPSGYIYEGVPSNRLSDVKTTLYYKDRDGNIVEWNALEYSQENPTVTDKNGVYEWFVPNGLWQVKAEREGYETYYTDWMRVPPAQMDVNFGMVSKEKPAIAQLYAYPKAIEINLNKYVYEEDIMTKEPVIVYANGRQVQGVVQPVNSEFDYWEGESNPNAAGGTENWYVSKIKFIPDTELAMGTNIKVSLGEQIRSYAGVNPEKDNAQEAVVKARPTGIAIQSNGLGAMAPGDNIVHYGETRTLSISVSPVEATKGKKLILTNENPWAISIPTEVTVNNDGIAEIPVTGLSMGEATISMLLEESNIAMTFDVTIDLQ